MDALAFRDKTVMQNAPEVPALAGRCGNCCRRKPVSQPDTMKRCFVHGAMRPNTISRRMRNAAKRDIREARYPWSCADHNPLTWACSPSVKNGNILLPADQFRDERIPATTPPTARCNGAEAGFRQNRLRVQGTTTGTSCIAGPQARLRPHQMFKKKHNVENASGRGRGTMLRAINRGGWSDRLCASSRAPQGG